MPRPLESDILQDPSSTPVQPAASDSTDGNSGDTVFKALRSLALSRPSSPATALDNNSHQQLPARSLYQFTVHKDSLQLSSSSSSVRTASKQTSYDNDQQTPSESAEEEEVDDVEFVMEPTPVPSEIDTISIAGSEKVGDSSKHIGNGVTCRYYNKSRCGKGNTCAYSHAPDLYSLRSHPEGRNVCLYFIHNNKCRFKGNQCNYSHSREDLRWDDEELAKQLAAKLTVRKNELTAKKEEKKKASRARQYSPSVDPINKLLPSKPLKITGPLREVTIPAVPPPKATPIKLNKKPNKNGPYAAGVNAYLPRWDSPQTLDRLQLMRFGLLAWDGSPPQQQYVPAPYIIYPPIAGYPPGGIPYQM